MLLELKAIARENVRPMPNYIINLQFTFMHFQFSCAYVFFFARFVDISLAKLSFGNKAELIAFLWRRADEMKGVRSRRGSETYKNPNVKTFTNEW